VLEVAGDQAAEVVAVAVEELEERQQQGEVRARQPARGLAGEPLRVADVRLDVGERELGVVGEPGPGADVLRQGGARSRREEAQLFGEGADEREVVDGAPLVDGDAAGVERGHAAPLLAGAVACAGREFGGTS
jgi:hypothetical protein